MYSVFFVSCQRFQEMKKRSIELKWAVIFVIATLAWVLLERLAGLHDEHIHRHALYTGLFAIPAIIIYALALRHKRKVHFKGTMTYKQGLVAGLYLTVFIAILSPLTQLILFRLITPGFFANATEYAVSGGTMSRTEAEAYFNLRNYTKQAFIGALGMGLLTSAIVAFFTSRKNVR
jgi:hypothetical protein